ncbi:fusion protein [Agrobacterium tumefaciens]|uniref:fusion protein n=1 Tax=Agrobacterium tumefaciens TaxID=358 RepID=UPI002AFFC7EA|nr:fusion protein [Agrobacterium tumefaciens]MEA1840736.1 fusion protein [Agrobacterium tumefaciens]
MATITWYGDGTATVAVGSRKVYGNGTGWLTEVAGLTPIKVGDKFGIHVGRPIVVETIDGDEELTLADDWPGPAQTDAPYKIELTNPTIVAVETMRRLMLSLSGGNLSSIAETSVGNDDLLIGIGPGVFSTINKAALVQGVEYDAFVPNLAGRAAYNSAAAGFSVLVIDIGDGRSALYFKNSATSGDWSAPSYVTGPVGPAGVNPRGNYSAGTAYVARDLVQYGGSTWIAKIATTGNVPPTLPVIENTQWLLVARAGAPGVDDKGDYSGATAYDANDIVLNNGSTWLALQPTTGNAPPTLPTESDAYWRLLARKGTDGSGTGDVVGPAGGVAVNDFAVFADTTGKLLKKAPNNVVGNALLSQLTAPAIKGRLTAGTGNVEDLTQVQARQVLGGWEYIGEFSGTSVSAINIIGLAAYRSLRLEMSFVANGNTSSGIRASADNGSSFFADSDEWRYTLLQGTGFGSVSYDDNIANFAPVTGDHSGATGLSTVSSVVIHEFNTTRNTVALGTVFINQPSSRVIRTVSAANKRNTAYNAIQFLTPGATLQTARIFLEGIRG